MPSPLKLTSSTWRTGRLEPRGAEGMWDVQAAEQAGVPQTPSGSAYFARDRLDESLPK